MICLWYGLSFPSLWAIYQCCLGGYVQIRGVGGLGQITGYPGETKNKLRAHNGVGGGEEQLIKPSNS